MQNVVGILDSLGVVELCPVDAGAAKYITFKYVLPLRDRQATRCAYIWFSLKAPELLDLGNKAHEVISIPKLSNTAAKLPHRY